MIADIQRWIESKHLMAVGGGEINIFSVNSREDFIKKINFSKMFEKISAKGKKKIQDLNGPGKKKTILCFYTPVLTLS